MCKFLPAKLRHGLRLSRLQTARVREHRITAWSQDLYVLEATNQELCILTCALVKGSGCPRK